ncbi:hypothetical protein D3C77_358990 [compost metagenome]
MLPLPDNKEAPERLQPVSKLFSERGGLQLLWRIPLRITQVYEQIDASMKRILRSLFLYETIREIGKDSRDDPDAGRRNDYCSQDDADNIR